MTMNAETATWYVGKNLKPFAWYCWLTMLLFRQFLTSHTFMKAGIYLPFGISPEHPKLSCKWSLDQPCPWCIVHAVLQGWKTNNTSIHESVWRVQLKNAKEVCRCSQQWCTIHNTSGSEIVCIHPFILQSRFAWHLLINTLIKFTGSVIDWFTDWVSK